MSPKKKPSREKRRQRKPRASGKAGSHGRRLAELAEALDIMLPELAARVAAIEHLLVEKQLCTREDLIKSREFVDLRRGKG